MPRISPSLLDNYSICPAFTYREYENTGNDAAAEGTLIHSALETDDDSDLTSEQQRVLEKTREVIQAQLIGYLDWENCPVHQRIELHEQKLTGSFGLRGKMDRAYCNLYNRKALCLDLKTGRNGLIRGAADSLQMAAYGDLLFTLYATHIDEVKVGLVSPRTNEVDFHVYSFADWEDLRDRIKTVMDSVDDPFKSPAPSDALCPKCAHFARCPAVQKSLTPPVSKTLSIPVSLLLKPVSDLTVDELAQNRAAADLFEKWSEVRKRAIDARAEAEKLELPGYVRVQRDGAPFVPTEKTAVAWELVKDLLAPEQFLASCGKISLGKLVEQLADDCLGETLAERKAKARDELFGRLEEVIAQSQGSSYLRRKARLDLRLLGVGSE
jgi:CRISPR/Cas system-associated exonuclease Cas4 (RecB family)